MQIPIFPLNGAVLYPETNLPLNIFEDRYIDMVDFALSNKRLIGIYFGGDTSKQRDSSLAFLMNKSFQKLKIDLITN